MANRKLYHIEFNNEIDGKRHYYFGSKSAIYQHFSTEQVGITYNTLRNLGDMSKKPYINSLCIIRQGELVASQSSEK